MGREMLLAIEQVGHFARDTDDPSRQALLNLKAALH